MRQFILSFMMTIWAVTAGAAQLTHCAPDAAIFQTDNGAQRIAIEVAQTADERARGLMFRDSMPQQAGMLFVYPREHDVAFWMKNTLIPLDMVFMDHSGTVVDLHENARPHDETPIPSAQPAQFVLEVNAGQARALGLLPGAIMAHNLVSQPDAAAPCK
ncbi:hypothetical protein BFP70_11160 [Thioclava sp. SK-1]|uniref:DUF192 domain-containing protein n=1 Tax=Thioclava sp. SK-1 TaxID=1889770 RepID=UPI000825A6A6|nr:DUF192 domain-containing protein [Thioclava sp. SK-1]OCX64698.1 hypothetical protein BFP70_11160 [Thioclava sp. SK-1]